MFEAKDNYDSINMSVKYILRIFLFFFLSGILLASNIVYADSISWLESQTTANGSFTSNLEVASPSQSTAEVLRAYHVLKLEALPSVALARNFLNTQTDKKIESLSRKIVASVEAGADTVSLVDKLVLLQNRDGGFGDQQGYQSRVIDTVFALNALGTAKSNNTTMISRAITYLTRQQATDGGFTHSSANFNSVYETALASIALQHFRYNYELTAAINGASTYLLNNQVVAGDWGSVWESALALLALIPITGNVSLYQPGVANLQTARAADGSWNQDIYATALALRAIYAADNVQVPQQSNKGTYTGQISNAADGQALEGVIIKLNDITDSETISKADGSFSLTNIAPGEHILVYSADGFSAATQTATAIAGKFTSLGAIKLSPLLNKAVVFGVVRDAATSQPLASVLVNISGTTTASVSTNTQGFYSFEVNPGQITLTTQLNGYDVVTGSTDVIAGQRVNFSLLLNATGTSPNITTVSAKATVVDAISNLPISSAVMGLVGGSTKATTNTAGKVLLENLSSGSLALNINAAGYQAVSTSTQAPAGSVIDLGIIKLTPLANKAVIFGVIRDAATSQPLASVTVNVSGATTATVTTNEQGSYSIEVDLGQITLMTQVNGYDAVIGSTDVVAGQRVNFSPLLSATGTSPNINTVSVKATVVDASTSLPISGATMSVAGSSVLGTTSADGKVILENLTAGSLTLNITATGYHQSVSASTLAPAGSVLDLGVVKLLKQEVSTKRTVKGFVTDATTGNVISGATVKIEGSNVSVVTNAEGYYLIDDAGVASFSLASSAIGYLSNKGQVDLAQPGEISVNIQLTVAEISKIKITSLSTELSSYPANTNITITAKITNSDTSNKNIRLYIVVLNAQGEVVDQFPAKLTPLGGNVSNALELIPASTSKDIKVNWDTGLSQPGVYQIKVQGISPDLNQLLTEKAILLTVEQTLRIGGGASFEPPIVQRVANNTVNVSGLVHNTGNQYIPAGSLTATITLETQGNERSTTFGEVTKSDILNTHRIRKMDADSQGNLYIAGEFNHKILKISPNGDSVELVMDSAYGVLSDIDVASNGKVYSVSAQSGAIYEYDPVTNNSKKLHDINIPNTTSLEVLNDGRVLVGTRNKGIYEVAVDSSLTNTIHVGMSQPQDMLKDSKGSIFINDSRGGIFKYNNGVFNLFLAQGVQDLRGMAIDATDNLYVAEYSKNRILKITPTKEITVYADGVTSPWGLSFDNGGRLLVASYGSHAVIAINPDGTKTMLVEETIYQPNHVVHAPDGSVYVMDGRYHLVKFDAQGNKQALFKVGIFNVQDMLYESEQRILILSNNRLYAVSGIDGSKTELATLSNASSISKAPNGLGYIIAESQGKLTFLANDGSTTPYLQAALSAPIASAISANGDKYILNTSYITKIATNGKVSRLVSGLINAKDMVITPSGDLFVAQYDKRIIKINPTGATTEYSVLSFYPRKLALKQNGSLIVLKNDNRTLYQIDSTGVVTQIASSGVAIYGMTVALDNTLWVHHQSYSKVSKLNADGSFQTYSGIYYPRAITPAAQGGVYVFSYAKGIKHIANDGVITDIFTNALGNIAPLSMFKQENNFWLLDAQKKLLKVDSAGILQNTFVSTVSIRDFKFLADGSSIILDGNNVLKLASTDALPELLTTGIYYEVNLLNANEILLATGTSLQKLDLTTKAITTLINSFGILKGFSISDNKKQIVAVDQRNNVLAYYNNLGVKQVSHIGLTNPKAILNTPDGKLLVSNTYPNTLMSVDANGKLSIFANQSGVTHLANLPNNKISVTTSSYLNVFSASGVSEKRIGSFNGTRSPLISDQSDWLAVADTNKLVRIHADNSGMVLSSGIADVRDIEVDSHDKVYFLDASRKAILSPEKNSGGVTLLMSGLSGGISLEFATNDELFVIENATQISNVDLVSKTKISVSTAPLVHGLSGLVSMNNKIKAIGSNTLASEKVIYTINTNGSGNSNTITTGTVVYKKSIVNDEIAAGSPAVNYDFGDFIPPVSGDYKVVISHSNANISGVLNNSLHVGGAALGNIALEKSKVFPGNRQVAGSISITGADSTSVTKLEPENVILAASTGTNGRAIASDSMGNIYASSTGKIVKVTTNGVVSDFVTGVNVGNGLAIDAAENIYAISGSKVLKITQQAVVTTHTTFATTVVAVAVDYQNQLYAMLNNGQLAKINQDGTTTVVMSGVLGPRSLSVDTFGNFYVLTTANKILKLNPERNSTAMAYSELNLRFEFEGVNVIADCSNNILFAPFSMPSVNFIGEESIIAQVTGNTGEARQIFYGPDIDPALGDMDVLFYDRFNDRVLVWTDRGAGKVFAFPVSCGGVDVEAHIVASKAVDVSGFDPAPTRTETLVDGSVKYIWVLSQVDNRGASIDFSAQFKGMKEGERRKLFKDAYLLFTNSFAPGKQAKTPLYIPELLAESQAGLGVVTDQTDYLENQDVHIALTVQNDNDVLLNGNIKLDIIDASNNIVSSLSDIAVVGVPVLGQINLDSVWNTELTLAADYKVKASLYSQTGLLLQTVEAAFVIQHSSTVGDPRARLRITVDKPVYNTSAQVTIGSLSHNITANVLINNAKVNIKVLNPDGSVNATLQQIIGDLASGNLRQRNSLQPLSSVPQGNYTVVGELVDASQTILATDQTQFQVAEDLSLTLKGSVVVAQPSAYSGGEQSCRNTIENNGSIDLLQAVYRQVLVNIDTATEQVVGTQQSVALTAAGAQYQFVNNVNTSALQTGQYSCVLQRQEGATWVTLAYDFFKVDMLSLIASLDATQYPENTPVTVSLKVDNPSNSAFSGSIKLSLLDVNDTLLKPLTSLVVDMSAGVNTQNLSYAWNTALNPAENYKIIATLYDAQNQSIVVQNLPFEITAAPQASLQLSLDKTAYAPAEMVVMSYDVSNTTPNAALKNTKLVITIRNQVGAPIHTEELVLNTPLAVGGTQNLVINYPTPANIANDTYSITGQVVSATNNTLAEATSSFVIKPSIDLAVSLNIDANNNLRLLVLLDNKDTCYSNDDDDDHKKSRRAKKKDKDKKKDTGDDKGHDDDKDDDKDDHNDCTADTLGSDPQGPQNAPSLLAQQVALEDLLKQNNWFYKIVMSAKEFTHELRLGNYNAYALFAEQIKLDKSTQQELQEAIFKGEGLLLAGDYNHRNNKLDTSLGIKIKGQTSVPSTLTINTVAGYQASTVDFSLLEKAREVQLEGASIIATYNSDLLCSSKKDDEDDDKDDDDKRHKKSKKDDDKSCNPSTIAVSHYLYGAGHASYAGFDLLAHMATPSADTVIKDLLIAMLKELQPSPVNRYFGNAIIPLKLTLDNLGTSTPGEVQLNLPAGVTLLDIADVIVQRDGQLVWIFDLAKAETATANFWIKLPNDASTLTLDTVIKTGIPPLLKDYKTLNLTIPVSAIPSIETILTTATALKASNKRYKKVISSLQKAKQYKLRGKLESALEKLLKASGDLAKIDNVAANNLRKDLAELIRSIEMQLL